MIRTDANRSSVNRYYAKNSHSIIIHKTFRLAKECGRVPRETTIVKHGMDRKALHGLLQDYAKQHPDSRAARKIRRFSPPPPSTQGAIAG